MTLANDSPYPPSRRFVLKLHRDAAPMPGRVTGRIENMATGRHFDFASGEQLVAWIAGELAAELLSSPGKVL